MTEEEKAAAEEKKRVIEEAKRRGAEKAKLTKSMIVLDVKPWDDETDLAAMEAEVRSIVKEGLLWGASKLVPIGYGVSWSGEEGGWGGKKSGDSVGGVFCSLFFPSLFPHLAVPTDQEDADHGRHRGRQGRVHGAFVCLVRFQKS